MTTTPQQQKALDIIRQNANLIHLSLGITTLDEQRHIISNYVSPKTCVKYKSYWEQYMPSLLELMETCGCNLDKEQNTFTQVFRDALGLDVNALKKLPKTIQDLHLETFFNNTSPYLHIQFLCEMGKFITLEYHISQDELFVVDDTSLGVGQELEYYLLNETELEITSDFIFDELINLFNPIEYLKQNKYYVEGFLGMRYNHTDKYDVVKNTATSDFQSLLERAKNLDNILQKISNGKYNQPNVWEHIKANHLQSAHDISRFLASMMTATIGFTKLGEEITHDWTTPYAIECLIKALGDACQTVIVIKLQTKGGENQLAIPFDVYRGGVIPNNHDLGSVPLNPKPPFDIHTSIKSMSLPYLKELFSELQKP